MVASSLEFPQLASRPPVERTEIRLSDAEIAQRVDRIRSAWSIAERVARRREAERRFADLLDKLTAA